VGRRVEAGRAHRWAQGSADSDDGRRRHSMFLQKPPIYGSNIATLVEKGTPGEAMHVFTTS